jgi:lipoprotein NlpI
MRPFLNVLLPALVLAVLPFAPARADAVADANKGVAAAQGGDYAGAIAAFTAAINSDELNLPGRAEAYTFRGIAKAATGDYGGAQDDLNSAVVLDSPYNADAYAYRGYFELVLGDPKKAAADLLKSADLHVWAYNAMWLYLARLKADIPDMDEHSLARHAAELDLMQWPGPVVNFLMGKAKASEIRTAAEAGDASALAARVCDTDFYVAEADLIRHDTASARTLLQRAADKCPFASFERMGASAELMRLKKLVRK